MGEGLERSFPPLRSFDGYRGQLPVQTTSFVGRQAELEQVGAELASARLVTLVGPGGVGKTRLAAQVGAEPGGQVSRRGVDVRAGRAQSSRRAGGVDAGHPGPLGHRR